MEPRELQAPRAARRTALAWALGALVTIGLVYGGILLFGAVLR